MVMCVWYVWGRCPLLYLIIGHSEHSTALDGEEQESRYSCTDCEECSSWAPWQRAFPNSSSTTISSTFTEVETCSTLFLILLTLMCMEKLFFSIESLKTHMAGTEFWRYHNPRQNGLLLSSSPDWSLLKDCHSFFSGNLPCCFATFTLHEFFSLKLGPCSVPYKHARQVFPLCSSLQHRLILSWLGIFFRAKKAQCFCLSFRGPISFSLSHSCPMKPSWLSCIILGMPHTGQETAFTAPWSPATQRVRPWHMPRQSIGSFPQL